MANCEQYKLKILSTGNLYGNHRNYLELKGLVQQIKPDILLITGDLFKSNLESPFLQSDFLMDCSEYLKEYSKHCSKVLYIFGETDLCCLDIPLRELVSEYENIICLHDENHRHNDYTFIGFPYVKDHEIQIKDWVRVDQSVVYDQNVEKAYYTDEEFNLNEIDDIYEHILNSGDMSSILTKKLIMANLCSTNNKNILVTHFPPLIPDDIQDNKYNLCLNNFFKHFKYVFCGHGKGEGLTYLEDKYTSNKPYIVNHGYHKNMLLYNVNIIQNGNIFYSYHPLNYDENKIINNALMYKDLETC